MIIFFPKEQLGDNNQITFFVEILRKTLGRNIVRKTNVAKKAPRSRPVAVRARPIAVSIMFDIKIKKFLFR